MKAYLEKINKEWLDDFVYITKYPLEYNKGYEVVPFDGNLLVDGDIKLNFDKTDVLIGSVETTSFFFNQLGIETPKYIGFPEELQEFYKRKIEIKKVKDLGNDFPYFVKPASEVKLFTGEVIENQRLKDLLISFYEVPLDTDIYVSETVNILSEYRCFIHKGELQGIQYYLGDYRIYPDDKVIDAIIKKYENQPVAYTIDVGVTDKGETIIIEINDMWAIGSYGFDQNLYTTLCVDRMREILK